MRTTLALATIMLLAIAIPLLAQEPSANPWPMRVALTGYALTSAVDRGLTIDCVARGACREVGAMRWANGHPGWYAATAASVDLAVGYGLHHLSRSRPRAAFWATVAITAAKVGVMVFNHRQLQRGGRV
jgi:hypothetical protein